MSKKLEVPKTYLAYELKEYTDQPGRAKIVEKEVKPLKKGDVLIKIHSGSINPSDLMFMRGLYGIKKKLPVVPGFEGSGIVVASGGGWRANSLVGKAVACTAPGKGDGTYAEYMVTDGFSCIPLNKDTTLEQGACLFVNPITALALTEQIVREKNKAFVQTAAASALGRMVLRLSVKKGIPGIHIVRRKEQMELLKSLGAEHILDSSSSNFERELRVLSGKLGATILLDAVAGELTGKVLAAMPYGSKCVVYGALSEEPISFHAGLGIFQDKKIEGFWLSSWLPAQSLWRLWKITSEVRSLLGKEFQTDIASRIPLKDSDKAIEEYAQNMTRGKVLIQNGWNP
ncbi:oxidoreductase, zinc-binding dehydrogenase family protein [Leptospira broomii serovar Hurstbridge str. 5399]|uniref:Oxidoreductase, zinc-binding dehydrogenase family protein n=1 Tax=Leptospira broomii serovar Hurstbridge str. 5399 TaxID=1049789 RepID=T0F405_9LEPT|nr:oxidoreductase, zinc-binding dehydrogenase family protein [Leptospira broomii serovar Hurstbridge str. 5399]